MSIWEEEPQTKQPMASTVAGVVDWQKLKFRLNPKLRKISRYVTGLTQLDEWIGGLPYGLTVIYGEAGSGKSLLAREIAKRSKRCLYFVCEVLTDAPPHNEYTHVDTVDYTVYPVGWQRAIEELKYFIKELNPTIVIVDSLTSFLGVTRKALPESDLREGISKIHVEMEGKLSVVGISEVRGSGNNLYPAGGPGVSHGNSMLIEMEHIFIDYPSMENIYGLDLGDDLYTLRVIKDKHNLASRKRARVIYAGDELRLETIKSRARLVKTEQTRTQTKDVWS